MIATIPPPIAIYEAIHGDSIPALNADTIFFRSEKQFAEYLDHYNLQHLNLIQGEAVPCNEVAPRYTFPDQNPDDYLHEERFEGMNHIVIFDHIVTRKMIMVFIPTTNNPDANLCGVQLIVQNPITGQYVVFKDIFSWIDENGKPIFNLNKKLYYLWGFDSGAVALPIFLTHLPTGLSYNFPTKYSDHREVKLMFNRVSEAYGKSTQKK